MVEETVSCPSCGSKKLYRNGWRHTPDGEIQRLLCRTCGVRFSQGGSKSNQEVKVSRQSGALKSRSDLAESSILDLNLPIEKVFDDNPLSLSKNVASHSVTNLGKGLNALCSYPSNAEYASKEMKNLAEIPQVSGLAGATKQTQDAKGAIVEFMWTLKKKGYKESTIETATKLLSLMAKRGADLADPESVKMTIALQPWNLSGKSRAVVVYTLFLKTQGQKWEPPIYKPVPQIPFIPTEAELDALIAGAGRKLSAYLQLLKETGMRSGEADLLKWTDLDFERNTVKITPEKNSYPRILPLSSKCVAMLKSLKKIDNIVFGVLSCNCMRISLCITRKRLARKLDNPRFDQIHFHTLRHWKATTLYHQTKDILYVKQFMGHRRIESTLVYVQIEGAIFQNMTEDWTCKVAETQDQARQLIESGFEFVMQKDNLAYFRKRK